MVTKVSNAAIVCYRGWQGSISKYLGSCLKRIFIFSEGILDLSDEPRSGRPKPHNFLIALMEEEDSRKTFGQTLDMDEVEAVFTFLVSS